MLLKKGTYPSGRIIKIRKSKQDIKGTIATCLEDYSGGLLLIKIDETQSFYKEGDELLTNVKYVTSITEEQWNIIIKENNKKKFEIKKDKNKKKIKKYRKHKFSFNLFIYKEEGLQYFNEVLHNIAD